MTFLRAAELERRASRLSGQALYAAVDEALNELLGHRLLTILQLEGTRLRRVYSSDALRYPAGGSKEITGDPWLRHLAQAVDIELTAEPSLLRSRFTDHAAIESLGCGSVLNVPARHRGRTLGTLNLLHQSGWYDGEPVQLALPFAALLASDWALGTPAGPR